MPAPALAAKPLRAYAKVNLFLRVLSRRPDGFHEIETLFAGIDRYDELTIEAAAQWSLHCTDATLDAGDSNLVTRAWRAANAAWGPLPPVRVQLRKSIPAGAGLGGGSADAATALRAFSTLAEPRPAERSIRRVAAQLGADVPFLLRPQHAALASGRGEKIVPWEGFPACWLVIAIPQPGVATAEAYARCTPSPDGPALDEIEWAWPIGDLDWLARFVHNDLEAAVLPWRPDLAAAKESLRRAGALSSTMTGSGSGFVGLCRSQEHAEGVLARLPADLPGFVARTLCDDSGPPEGAQT
jgi:4-diphosphocytidyl-2-C-methyl-D-erythritol kinase